MLIISDEKLNYEDVLIVPQRSTLDSRASVDLLREYKFPHCKETLKCTGIIASNMWNIGTIDMIYALSRHNCLVAVNKYEEKEILLKLFDDPIIDGRFFVSVGESDEELEKFRNIYRNKFFKSDRNRLKVCIDVANGYRASFVDFIKKVREIVGCDAVIMAGNVTTPEMTQELILSGVDIVKIGIGPGSVCKTRLATGVGYPMLSAIIECANAAHGLGGHICADGGCRTSGDVCKAFCAGADFVMLGGLLAGTNECQGDWKYINNKFYQYTDPNSILAGKYPFVENGIVDIHSDGSGVTCCTFDKSKHEIMEHGQKSALKFFGMSSDEAMKKFGGEKSYRTSEGSVRWIDVKGPAEDVIEEILGGLRSCATYIGARNIKEMPKRAVFVKVYQ